MIHLIWPPEEIPYSERSKARPADESWVESEARIKREVRREIRMRDRMNGWDRAGERMDSITIWGWTLGVFLVGLIVGVMLK